MGLHRHKSQTFWWIYLSFNLWTNKDEWPQIHHWLKKKDMRVLYGIWLLKSAQHNMIVYLILFTFIFWIYGAYYIKHVLLFPAFLKINNTAKFDNVNNEPLWLWKVRLHFLSLCGCTFKFYLPSLGTLITNHGLTND